MLSLPNSPLSSPSSSPSLGPIDSSPLSSPNLDPLPSPSISPGPSHPYAGSTKAVGRPRSHERRQGKKRRRESEIWASQIDSDNEGETSYPWKVQGSGHASREADGQARRVVDPFSGSAKPDWVPPVREKKMRIHSRSASDASTSTNMFSILTTSTAGLQDAFVYRPPQTSVSDQDDPDVVLSDLILLPSPLSNRTRRTSMNSEQKRWEEAISNAIAGANGVIDLRQDECSPFNTSLTSFYSASGVLGTVLTHIPSSVGDLASLVLLQSGEEQKAQILPRRASTPDPDMQHGCGRKREFVRSSTVPMRPLGQSLFDYTPPRPGSKAKSSLHVPLAQTSKSISRVSIIISQSFPCLHAYT